MVWGQLVNVHKVDVDTLANEFRCVEREGVMEGGRPVTFLRVFKLGQDLLASSKETSTSPLPDKNHASGLLSFYRVFRDMDLD